MIDRASRPHRLAIIGGGWAGLACAEALATGAQAYRIAIEVDLLEAAPQPGGRARGIAQTVGGAPADNGQHLLIGAYTETLALLHRAGAKNSRHWSRHVLSWRTLARTPSKARLQSVFQGIGIAWSLWRGRGRPWEAADEGNLADWATRLALHPSLIDEVLRPLAEAALNTAWHEASARVFRDILHEALARGPLSLAAWHPRENLSRNAIDPLVAHLQRLGVAVHTRARIASLIPWMETAQGGLGKAGEPGGPGEAGGRGRGFTLDCHATTARPTCETLEARTYDAIVLALPARSSARLWQESLLPETSESRRWAGVPVRGIATLWIPVPPDVLRHHRPLPAGRLTCLQLACGLQVVALARPAGSWGQLIALVASALHPDQLEGRRLEQEVRQAARQWLASLGWPEPLAGGPDSRWVADPMATWACTAEGCDRGDTWGSPQTGYDGIWRAADDGYPGFPATIEAAVRSGRQTARLVLQQLQGL